MPLSAEHLADLNARARGRDLAPHARAAGADPLVAPGLDQPPDRRPLGAPPAAGAPRRRRPPGRPAPLTGALLATIEPRLDADAAAGRTGTRPHLAAWPEADRGGVLTPGWLAARLEARRSRWERAHASLRHKQAAPDRQATKRAALEASTA